MALAQIKPSRGYLFLALALYFLLPSFALAQEKTPPQPAEKQAEAESKPSDSSKRVELNLLGKTDASLGESRRNENVTFNLVDNNALKELNVRLGTTATIVREFNPASGYFSSEFGNAPRASRQLSTRLASRWPAAAVPRECRTSAAPPRRRGRAC